MRQAFFRTGFRHQNQAAGKLALAAERYPMIAAAELVDTAALLVAAVAVVQPAAVGLVAAVAAHHLRIQIQQV